MRVDFKCAVFFEEQEVLFWNMGSVDCISKILSTQTAQANLCTTLQVRHVDACLAASRNRAHLYEVRFSLMLN